jgi:hypothetical protein
MDGEKRPKYYKDRKRGNYGGYGTNGDEDNDDRRARKLWMVRVVQSVTR